VTGFVGRQRELTELPGLLRSARLVTVCGPGGVGKTRLTLKVAARLAAKYADGVCLAELSGLRDPELLPNAVAACLGLPEDGTHSPLDAVIEYLRNRRQLLILDTCEHLVDACAMFSDVLLRSTTEVTVAATSRQPLDVPGENVYLLQPLPVLAAGANADAGGDAVTLFAQCAAAAVPGFAVTDANRADVIRLCTRLDGVPLAIELAAVRLRAIPLPALLARLEDRFRLLTGGRRASLPHHQTLRTATEWSHDLCTPAEQVLWARLSVFAGAFDIEAAEQVCEGEPLTAADLLATLIGLVDKSIVLRAGEEDARYRLLDTIREFGAEKLAAAGEESALRERHVARYLALTRTFAKHSNTRGYLHLFDGLRREDADVRAALEYAFTLPGRERAAAAMTAALYPYWQRSCSVAEGRHWLGKVLDRFVAPSSERAWALVSDGYLAVAQGDTDAAVAALEESVKLAEEAGDVLARARGQVMLNLALAFGGRYQQAERAGSVAGEYCEAAGDGSGLVSLDLQMGYLWIVSGRMRDGVARCEQGLSRLGPDSDERWQQGYLHAVLGFGYYRLGDYQASTGEHGIALTMQQEIQDTLGMAYPLECLGWVAAACGRSARAACLLGAADHRWRLAGGRMGLNPDMEALHDAADKAVREALGEDRYLALHRDGSGRPQDEIIAFAIGGGDTLPDPVGAGRLDQAGTSPLTSRENEIAALVARGLSNRAIADRLVISKRTVDAHIEHIFGKLGVSSRVQLVNWLNSGMPAKDEAT
jgi:non-specific serine/threonine protein kinase